MGTSFLVWLLLGIYVNEKSNTEVPPLPQGTLLMPPTSTQHPSDFLAPCWDSQLPGCSLGIPSPVLLQTLFQLQSTELTKTLAFNHKTCG